MTRTALPMVFVEAPERSPIRIGGFFFVAALHLLFAWALVSGTARRGLELLKKPIQAVVVTEVSIVPPPPAPKPPRPKKSEAQPQTAPKPFIPPPEVALPAPAAPAVVAAAEPPKAAPAIVPAPPAPAVVAESPPAPRAPPAPAPAAPSAPPRSASIGSICPTQVQPEMPRRAIREGISGTVVARVRIANGVVQDVSIISGPRVFHEPVMAAIRQYKCAASSGELEATQEFVFKLD